MKKIISIVLVITFLTMLIFNSTAYAVGDYQTETVAYSADVVLGKVFNNGENVKVDNTNQLDTYITDVKIICGNDGACLQFKYNNSLVAIESYLISSTVNNIDGEHYSFSPKNFNNPTWEFIVANFTTNANEHDLMPVNYDLLGETAISIILKDKSTGDVYYWQGDVFSNTASISLVNNDLAISDISNVSDNVAKTIIDNANENYYLGENSRSVDVLETEGEYVDNYVGNTNNIATISDDFTEDNPFYIYEIPDSTFKSVTNEWNSGVSCTDVVDTVTHDTHYYVYSYERYGSDNVYTLIMLIDFATTERALDDSNGGYANKTLELLVLANETVVYYPSDNDLDLGLGMNNIVKFSPAIRIEKLGSSVGHIVTTRTFGGEGYKDSSSNEPFWVLVGQAFSSFIGKIDEAYTKGVLTGFVNALEFLSSMPVSEVLGADRLEFGYSVEKQVNKWGSAVGGVKVKMDGYLRDPYNKFFVTAEFIADTGNIAGNNRWVVERTISGH